MNDEVFAYDEIVLDPGLVAEARRQSLAAWSARHCDGGDGGRYCRVLCGYVPPPEPEPQGIIHPPASNPVSVISDPPEQSAPEPVLRSPFAWVGDFYDTKIGKLILVPILMVLSLMLIGALGFIGWFVIVGVVAIGVLASFWSRD